TLVVGLRSRSLAGLRQWPDRVPAAASPALLALTFLADQARLAIDATARTLVRLGITRRHLLEWETAASTERRLGTSLGYFALSMWPAPALALALAVAVVLVRPTALRAAVPALAASSLSPVVALR